MKSFSDVLGEMLLEKIQRRRDAGEDVTDAVAKYAEWAEQRAQAGEPQPETKQ